MLVKWLGIFGLCIVVGLTIAIAPELWRPLDGPRQEVSAGDRQRVVLACVKQAEQKLKAMGPMVSWDPNEVRRNCEAAVDERVRVSN